jgi:hypothetical protein
MSRSDQVNEPYQMYRNDTDLLSLNLWKSLQNLEVQLLHGSYARLNILLAAHGTMASRKQ